MPIPEDTLRAMEEAAERAQNGLQIGFILLSQMPEAYRPHAITNTPTNVLALIAAYREQGRELENLRATDAKTAPVQRYPKRIPWEVHLKAYEAYAREYGRSQSAERLAERGGFGVNEMDVFYPRWREHVEELPKLRADLAAATAAASARIDEIAALTAERDEALDKALYWKTYSEAQADFATLAAHAKNTVDSLTALLNKAGVAVAPFLEWISDELKVADEMQPDLRSFDDGCEVDPDDLAHAASINPLKWGDFRNLRALRAEIEAALQPKDTPDVK